MFVLDESGSVGSTNFGLVKNFIADQITNDMSAGSNVGVISYASSQLLDWRFSDTQTPRTALVAKVNGLVFSGGGTSTANALTLAVNEYTANDDPSKDNILVLVTDGVPSSPVCGKKAALDAAGIKVIIIGVGNFNTAPVACLVDNPVTDMILLQNFNQFTNLQIPCPSSNYICTRQGQNIPPVVYQTCTNPVQQP
jgi:uncharacterized protein with von Willebrand factor type A (vWA) domain